MVLPSNSSNSKVAASASAHACSAKSARAFWASSCTKMSPDGAALFTRLPPHPPTFDLRWPLRFCRLPKLCTAAPNALKMDSRCGPKHLSTSSTIRLEHGTPAWTQSFGTNRRNYARDCRFTVEWLNLRSSSSSRRWVYAMWQATTPSMSLFNEQSKGIISGEFPGGNIRIHGFVVQPHGGREPPVVHSNFLHPCHGSLVRQSNQGIMIEHPVIFMRRALEDLRRARAVGHD